MLKPEAASILSIFNGSQKVIVPKYQRNFTWGRNEAQELIEDIKSKSADTNFNLFLGTVIFDVANSKERQISVIDGQQRLTTSSLLLIACRQVAKKKNQQLAGAVQDKISFKDPYTGKYSGQRLTVSPSIKEIYNYVSDENWNGEFPDRIDNKSVKKQVNKIRPLYEYFLSEVKALKPKELEKFVISLYDAYFIRIDIENTSQAFDIFERMNARGVPLDVADLLKNHLFSAVDSAGIEERWLDIIENSGTTPLRMLKYFWVSKTGYVRKSELYKKIREYSLKNGPEKLVNELEEFSFFYWLVREGEKEDLKEFLKDKELEEVYSNESYLQKFQDVIEALRYFRITQLYPVLFSAINSYKKDKNRSPKELLDLLDVFEKYHFINNMICERVGNEVEKLYTDYAKDFNENKFNILAKNLKTDLRNRLAKKDEFISNFTNIGYASDSIALICYIFDRYNNISAKGGQKVKVFYSDSSIQKKNFNVEHFLPQKEKNNKTLDKETLESIDNIGNLLVISRHTNSSLGSLTPEDKIKLIKSKVEFTNNLPYLNKFITDHEKKASKWNSATINDRANNLAKIAYERIWQF